ncbi:hypothetical protein, partial [Dysgonomonas gadei]
ERERELSGLTLNTEKLTFLVSHFKQAVLSCAYNTSMCMYTHILTYFSYKNKHFIFYFTSKFSFLVAKRRTSQPVTINIFKIRCMVKDQDRFSRKIFDKSLSLFLLSSTYIKSLGKVIYIPLIALSRSYIGFLTHITYSKQYYHTNIDETTISNNRNDR